MSPHQAVCDQLVRPDNASSDTETRMHPACPDFRERQCSGWGKVTRTSQTQNANVSNLLFLDTTQFCLPM